jgi:paraquat-inducible protein B
MSKKANPAMIGAFVVGGIALAILAVALLASGALFGGSSTLVSYFSEPVNGLSIGAPVKYRGIQLGQVTRIGLERADEGNDYAEVRYELDHARLVELGGSAQTISDENFALLVREGLRSRLEVESIVTGVVFVTLEFKEDVGPPVFINPEADVVEVPTTASPMSELTESAGQVIARLSNIDVNSLSENLIRLTETLNEKLEGVEVAELEDNLTESSERLREILSDPQLSGLIESVDDGLDEFRVTNEMFQDLLSNLHGSVGRVDSITENLQETMAAMSVTTRRTSDMLATNSDFRRSLESALSEIALTMKSLRRLSDMLERNPRAMVTGKPEDRK